MVSSGGGGGFESCDTARCLLVTVVDTAQGLAAYRIFSILSYVHSLNSYFIAFTNIRSNCIQMSETGGVTVLFLMRLKVCHKQFTSC
jgi:hypothetical protein